MKALKWVAFGLILIAVLFVGIGALSSPEYAFARSIVVAAPPAAIHPWLEDLKRWEEWAPWNTEDPTIVTTYGDVTVGAGASQTWTSESGDGRLTLTRSDPQSGIAYDMAFVDGEREMPATCRMTYREVDGGTQVIWEMQGTIPLPILGSWIAKTMDAAAGPMFEQGLATLKTRVEAAGADG